MAPVTAAHLRDQDAARSSHHQRCQAWRDHVFRAQDLGEHGVVEQALLAHQLQHTAAAEQRLAGQAGAVVVADVGVQRGDQTNGAL